MNLIYGMLIGGMFVAVAALSSVVWISRQALRLSYWSGERMGFQRGLRYAEERALRS